MSERFMNIGEALEIVHMLASWAALSRHDINDEVVAGQQLALDTVHDFIANNFEETERTLTCEIHRGVLSRIIGLPPGWSYTVVDWDLCPSCGGKNENCEVCK